MANVVQMGVDAFWAQLQAVENRAKRVIADLNVDKARLQAAYTSTKNDPDTRRRAQNQAALQPLIHNNSVLRLRYRELVAKFNATVQAASDILKRAGLSTPGLSGCEQLGVAPLVIGGVAVAGLAAMLLILKAIETATQSQRQRTDALIRCMEDPSLTPEARERCAAALRADTPKGLLDLSGMVPALAIVALIVLGPQLMRTIGARRAAA
jgi:hypothetical protein